MIQSIGAYPLHSVGAQKRTQNNAAAQNPIADNVVNFRGNQNNNNVSNLSLINAYQAMNGIQLAKSVNFMGGRLANIFDELRQPMVTCQDLDHNKQGEHVGSRVNVSEIAGKFSNELVHCDDAVKTTVAIKKERGKKDKIDTVTILPARTQLKKMPGGDILYEMVVRAEEKLHIPRNRALSKKEDEKFLQNFNDYEIIPKRTDNPKQQIQITVSPNKTKEQAHVLETKGNLMAVVEDGDNVILTNSGLLYKRDNSCGTLSIEAIQHKNKFKPFDVAPQPIREREVAPSKGEGTEIVIGMEDGRFVGELIKSVEDFTKKVDNGQVLLDPFVESPNAKNVQLAMLAGGFGSRAEYTNAASSAIFHGEKDGAQSTKGVFQTPTGLTPMETTFITLHKAGLLDCSKLKIGGNVKLYLNKSGVNKGNGGFTVDLYNKMEREGRKSLMLFPNDSMSRLTGATQKATFLMNKGDAAITMIAKQVKSEDAKGNFGIMKLGKNNEILEFAEKPKVIPDGYEKDGKCLTNTFQFAVSKEAFAALAEIEPFLPQGKGKETRDWSKLYVPILMQLTQEEDPAKISDVIYELTKEEDEYGNVTTAETKVPEDAILRAKAHVQGQKVYAVPTDEPWADCGTLNALYHTTMEIASGNFKLEDFERAHVLECVNTHTGLVATSKEQKDEIYGKYWVDGEVMAVKKAEKVDTDAYLKKYKDQIVVNEKAA